MNSTSLVVAILQSTTCLAFGSILVILIRKHPDAKILVCRGTLLVGSLLFLASPFISTRQNPMVPVSLNVGPAIPQKEIASVDARISNVVPTASVQHVPTETNQSIDYTALLPIVYGVGLIGSIGFLILGAFSLSKLRRSSTSVKTGRIYDRLIQVANHHHVSMPALFATPAGVTPFVSGLVHKSIHLPLEWLEEQDDAIVGSILEHEVAHLASRDLEWLLIGRLACTILWFNPLTWWLFRDMRISTEERCDQQVVDAGITQTDYANALVMIQERFHESRIAGVSIGAIARGSTLAKRVRTLLANDDFNQMNLSLKTRMFLVALVISSSAVSVAFIAKPTQGPLEGALKNGNIRPEFEAVSESKEDFGPFKLKDGSVAKLEFLYQKVGDKVVAWLPSGKPTTIDSKLLAEDNQPGNANTIRALIRITNVPKPPPNLKVKYHPGQISVSAVQVLDIQHKSIHMWIRTSKLNSDKGMIRLGVPYGKYRTIVRGPLDSLKVDKDPLGNTVHLLPFPKKLIEKDQVSYKDFIALGRDSSGKSVAGGSALNGNGLPSEGKWMLQLFFNELKDRKVVENKAVKEYEIQARDVQTVDFTGIHLTPNSN